MCTVVVKLSNCCNYFKAFRIYLVSLKYRETLTVETVKFYKKLYFFHEKSFKKKKTGTNFTLLCQSTNLVGQVKKAYVHRNIKILHFLRHATIQKFLTELQNIFIFLAINHLQPKSCI